MEIIQSASAGTTESSDVLIMIDSNGNEGIQIELDSNVAKQFGRQICAKIEATLKDLAVTQAKVKVIDKGALDCTIQARTIAAVYRACGVKEIDWQVIRSWNA